MFLGGIGSARRMYSTSIASLESIIEIFKSSPQMPKIFKKSIGDIFSSKNINRSIDVHLTSSDKTVLVSYAEFCHRVACLMNLHTTGPIALRYDVKKWSILKSPFVHKTSFKQYERRTYKRLVRLSNVHPILHQKYLWYIQHHLPSSVEFSSTVFEYESFE